MGVGVSKPWNFFVFLNKKLILMLPLINNDAFVVPCCAALPALLIGLARILGTFWCF